MYDDTHVAAHIWDICELAENNYYTDERIITKGGSGDFTYEVVAKNYVDTASASGGYLNVSKKTIDMSKNKNSGFVAVKITDNVYHTNLMVTCKVTLVTGCTISGKVTDAKGKAVPGADLLFIPAGERGIEECKQEGFNSSYYKYCDVYSNGTFSALVPKGYYHVTMEDSSGFTNEDILIGEVHKNVSKTLKFTDFVVNVKSKNNVPFSGEWYSSNAERRGSGTTLWLRPGKTDDFYSEGEVSGMCVSKGQIHVTKPTIKLSTVEANVTKTSRLQSTPAFANDRSFSVRLDQYYTYFKYVATKTETVEMDADFVSDFYSSSIAILVNSTDANEKAQRDAIKYDHDTKFSFVQGHTYYIGVRSTYKTETGGIVTIRKSKVS